MYARDLFLRHRPERGDYVVVFGHSEPRLAAMRARHAACLFREGFAPKLVLSGGAKASAVSEAEQMAEVCVAAGVPRERLLLERESRNTFENVTRTVAILEREALLADLQTVLLVSCPWHARRVYLTARQGFPAHVRLLCCPHDDGCGETNWQGSGECRARIEAEVALLERFIKIGLLRNGEE